MEMYAAVYIFIAKGTKAGITSRGIKKGLHEKIYSDMVMGYVIQLQKRK